MSNEEKAEYLILASRIVGNTSDVVMRITKLVIKDDPIDNAITLRVLLEGIGHLRLNLRRLEKLAKSKLEELVNRVPLTRKGER